MLVAQKEVAHDHDVSQRHTLPDEEGLGLEVGVQDGKGLLDVILCPVGVLSKPF